MTLRNLFSTAVIVAFLLASRSTRADDDRAVLLLGNEHLAATNRILAELLADGFAVLSGHGDDSPEGTPIDEPRTSVVGVVRLRPRNDIEVWIRDKSGTLGLREVVTDVADPMGGASNVSLRAVEVVRASLLEGPARTPVEARRDEPWPPPSAGPPAPVAVAPDRWIDAAPAVVVTVPIAPPPPPPRPPRVAASLGLRYGVGVAAALSLDPGGLAPEGAVALDAHVVSRAGVGVGVAGFMPPFVANIGTRVASSDVRLAAALVGARLELGPAAARFGGAVELGPGLVWLHAVGRAIPPYVNHDVSAVTFAPAARASLRLAIVGPLQLTGAILAAVPVPTPRIELPRFAATDTHVSISTSLGVEYARDGR